MAGERVKCLREPGSRGGGVVAGATVGGWVRGVDVVCEGCWCVSEGLWVRGVGGLGLCARGSNRI